MRKSFKRTSKNIASFSALALIFFGLVVFAYLRKQNSQDPNTYYNLALSYAEQNRFADARDAYQRALSLKPDLHEARLNFGILQHKSNHLDEAIIQYQEVIRQSSRYALAHYNLGVAYYQKGLIEASAKEYRKGLELDPLHADSHYNLGYLYAHHTEWQDKALEHFRTAAALKPAFVKAHYEIGLVYEKRGLASQAKSAWEAAVAIAPDFEPARKKLNTIR